MNGVFMKKTIFLWQLCGFAFTSFAGTLLHYLFEWSGRSAAVALISGVNESTFEHMKLLFVPMLAFAFVQSVFMKESRSFWCVKLCGIIVGILVIPTVFYTYNGAFGSSPDWFNITLFFVAAAIAYYLEYRAFINNRERAIPELICFVILILIAALFIVFTFIPPRIPLFIDPIDKSYGYMK